MSKKIERLKMEQGKHIAVAKHTLIDNHPLHWHSFFELEIILSGKGRYVINDIEYDLSEYNFFLLTPIDFHCVEADTKIELINVSFDEEAIGEKEIASLVFNKINRAYILDQNEYQRMLSAHQLLMHECQSGGECTKILLKYILSSVFKNTVNEIEITSNTMHDLGIKKAIVYMQMHFKEDITLPAIAKEAGYHPTYFSELFKKTTGQTFIEYLTKLRIGYAKTLLSNGFSVSEACFGSGFGSFSNFSATFKRHCGISPGKYQKSL